MSGDVSLGLAGSGRVGPSLVLAAGLPVKGSSTMAIRITDDMITLGAGSRVVATAQFSEHAVADRPPHGPCPLTRSAYVALGIPPAGGRGEGALGETPPPVPDEERISVNGRRLLA
jgi:hypothetical protein